MLCPEKPIGREPALIPSPQDLAGPATGIINWLPTGRRGGAGMNAHGLAIWSMALGAIATVALARVADLGVRPTLSQLQGATYHATVFLLVLILSGGALQLWPGLAPKLMQAAQVLAGAGRAGPSEFLLRPGVG